MSSKPASCGRIDFRHTEWASEEFGRCSFGDVRIRWRLIRMAQCAANDFAGTISDVFRRPKDRRAAYKFVENPRVDVASMLSSMSCAMLDRCATEPFIFVPVDGTYLTLTDRALSKDFGLIGGPSRTTRGICVISALGVDPDGTPHGIAAMTYWTRAKRVKKTHKRRRPEDKECKHWLSTIDQTITHIEQSGRDTRAWFQLDREADSWAILTHLAGTGHLFTVRGSWNRRVRCEGKKTSYLRKVLEEQIPRGRHWLEVPASKARCARRAKMLVSTATVILDLLEPISDRRFPLQLNVVWVREESDVPQGEKPIEWILLTNHSVEHFEDVCLVIDGYTQRWKIEEFHRTWKQGGCDVESTQLHRTKHVERWATLLAAVAMRTERLKYLSRNKPDLPASEELSPAEINALLLLKRSIKKKTETIPNTMPTIAQATQWIAEIGGYTGKSSGGPPGSVTIQRGLEKIETAVNLMKELDQAGMLKMR